MTEEDSHAVFVHGAPFGSGGLGAQSANALRALELAFRRVTLHGPSTSSRGLVRRLTQRWLPGSRQLAQDRSIGKRAALAIANDPPRLCYTFTQVGLEPLEWGRSHSTATVLESPNGHIRSFRRVYESELKKWGSGHYPGHPTEDAVSRIEAEYEAAGSIRVSSNWARASLIAGGVSPQKVSVFQQSIDLARYRPPADRPSNSGPLRCCFVGSLDLRKGFIYLLLAAQLIGKERVTVEFVGNTGDRTSRRILERERRGLSVVCAPGDPRPAYARAELFVLPTLEDGSPFALAEAMASGLPAVTTTSCGGAEWIREGETGWIVPPCSAEALAAALDNALTQRQRLPEMGRAAHLDTERRAGPNNHGLVAEWLQRLL